MARACSMFVVGLVTGLLSSGCVSSDFGFEDGLAERREALRAEAVNEAVALGVGEVWDLAVERGDRQGIRARAELIHQGPGAEASPTLDDGALMGSAQEISHALTARRDAVVVQAAFQSQRVFLADDAERQFQGELADAFEGQGWVFASFANDPVFMPRDIAMRQMAKKAAEEGIELPDIDSAGEVIRAIYAGISLDLWQRRSEVLLGVGPAVEGDWRLPPGGVFAWSIDAGESSEAVHESLDAWFDSTAWDEVAVVVAQHSVCEDHPDLRGRLESMGFRPKEDLAPRWER